MTSRQDDRERERERSARSFARQCALERRLIKQKAPVWDPPTTTATTHPPHLSSTFSFSVAAVYSCLTAFSRAYSLHPHTQLSGAAVAELGWGQVHPRPPPVRVRLR